MIINHQFSQQNSKSESLSRARKLGFIESENMYFAAINQTRDKCTDSTPLKQISFWIIINYIFRTLPFDEIYDKVVISPNLPVCHSCHSSKVKWFVLKFYLLKIILFEMLKIKCSSGFAVTSENRSLMFSLTLKNK